MGRLATRGETTVQDARMSSLKKVAPVKLIAAVLWQDESSLDWALAELRRVWGEIDFSGADRPFDATDYYEPEMGKGLMRRLVAFGRLVPPESLREAKLVCNEIEERLCHCLTEAPTARAAGNSSRRPSSSAMGRTVNLDVGYLDHNKLVLASVKYAGQKIHLGDGVYADLVARYKDGRYQPFEWTFPDFRDGRYDEELA